MWGRSVAGELRYQNGRTATEAAVTAVGVAFVVDIVGVSPGLAGAQQTALSPLGSAGRTVSSRGLSQPRRRWTLRSGLQRPRLEGRASLLAMCGAPPAIPMGTRCWRTARRCPPTLPNWSSGVHLLHVFVVSGILAPFPAAAVSDVARRHGVGNIVGALELQAVDETGTVPTIVATFTIGGQTIDATVGTPEADTSRAGVHRLRVGRAEPCP